ncbi:MAG: hypothetical protein AAF909_11495 [Pseudomonadota bacterium]
MSHIVLDGDMEPGHTLCSMKTRLTPADVVFAMIGPPDVVGPICETHVATPYNWMRASGGRDAGDIPSARHMRRLLAHAEAEGIPLTAEHLIRGATQAELDALLSQLAPASPSNPIAAE